MYRTEHCFYQRLSPPRVNHPSHQESIHQKSSHEKSSHEKSIHPTGVSADTGSGNGLPATTPDRRRLEEKDSAAGLPDDFHWHGFTQMADYDRLVIESAERCVLRTDDGRELIDGVSSLWCNLHGHKNRHIDDAVRAQLDRVAHVTTLGMSADVTDQLAQALTTVAPRNLRHTFFASDGSSAVEAAMKMAFQFWCQTDPSGQRDLFLALGNAYHGDTTGAVSLGGIDKFHRLFAPILFRPLRGPAPCSYRLPGGLSEEEALEFYADQYERIIAEHHHRLAAVVMEPLVQGAAGMITHPKGFLRRIRQCCDRYDVLMIVDEVATGFGRTGRMFACEHESVQPDILCLGKGITGGYLPMSATMASDRIFEAFLGKPSDAKQFFHGHTYGGNPLAAAAAIASLGLLQKDGMMADVRRKAKRFADSISSLADHPNVGDIRGRGLMIGIEVVCDRETKASFSPSLQIGRRICQAMVRRGVWLRPLGDVIVVLPPLVISDAELDKIAVAVRESIDEVCGDVLSSESGVCTGAST